MALVAACTALSCVATAPAAPAEPSPGQLWGFGSNGAAQLGNETNVETQEPSPPTPVVLPSEAGAVVDAAAGGAHSLVITSSGYAYAFGWNYHGQLGNPTYIEGNGPHGWNPVPALIVLPGQDSPVVQVAGAGDSSFALTESGQLYGFGSNISGQLGNETNINQVTGKANPTPALVTLPGQVGPVIEVAHGLQHTLVLTESGQLYSFGANTSGQLGRETTAEPMKWANPTPTLVTLPGQDGSVVKIAAGRESSLALTESGQLYSFGNNRFGELGYEENSGPGPDPFENNHQTPTVVPMPEGAGEIVDIAAGSFHTLVLTDENQLYSFGKNTLGALGNSTNLNNQEANPTPTAVSFPGGVGQIEQIDAGYEDSFVLSSTGRGYSFGWNYFGEQGRTTNNKSLKPNPVPTLVPLSAGAALAALSTGPTSSHTFAVIGMVVRTSSLPGGSESSAYAAAVEAEGGAQPYQWAASGLPPGLSIDPESGEIAGVPTVDACATTSCKYNPKITVTDSDGMEASRSLTISLGPEPPPDDGGGGGGDGGGDTPPKGEDKPVPAQLRLVRARRAAGGSKLLVTGTIVGEAQGVVAVRSVTHQLGRRRTVTRSAEIVAGRWRVRLPLQVGRRSRSAVQLSARFAGSPGVESDSSRWRLRFG